MMSMSNTFVNHGGAGSYQIQDYYSAAQTFPKCQGNIDTVSILGGFVLNV